MFFQQIKRKHRLITAYAVLAAFLLYSGLTAFKSFVESRPSFKVNLVLAEETAPLPEVSLSLQDSNGILSYLKKLDSPSGRIKFDDLRKENELQNLLAIRERLAELITGKYRLNDFISRFKAPDYLASTPPPAVPELPTVLDLTRRMALEIQIGQLTLQHQAAYTTTYFHPPDRRHREYP